MSKTDKLTGPAAAAWEITDLIDIAFCCEHRNKRHDVIEAIILKHCSEDKAVEMLVEAARSVVDIFHTESKTYEAMAMVMKLETALANYEKVKK